ncbi:MAG: hypothetical protein HYR56_31555 [Acidobacteria bacterium]|nr:hypothetical protein [Acidobacteriota bacterium]MBI3425950.1 hypothetical protein [Acidobacteriota bacterium]
MSQTQSSNYDLVLSTVRQWPTAQQMELVQDVLRELSPRIAPPKKRQKTLVRALGLLTTEQPAPTDAEVKQWLDEHRMEKYG